MVFHYNWCLGLIYLDRINVICCFLLNVIIKKQQQQQITLLLSKYISPKHQFKILLTWCISDLVTATKPKRPTVNLINLAPMNISTVWRYFKQTFLTGWRCVWYRNTPNESLQNYLVCLNTTDKSNECIRFPETEEHFCQAKFFWSRKGQIPNTIGVIDCTHVQIQSPHNHPEHKQRSMLRLHLLLITSSWIVLGQDQLMI